MGPTTHSSQKGAKMKKRTILLTAILCSATLLLATAHAATLRCTVVKVDGDQVTMECGEKAKSLAEGVKVKVKTVKAQTAAIEGC